MFPQSRAMLRTMPDAQLARQGRYQPLTETIIHE
jgi:hypothetical protein